MEQEYSTDEYSLEDFIRNGKLHAPMNLVLDKFAEDKENFCKNVAKFAYRAISEYYTPKGYNSFQELIDELQNSNYFRQWIKRDRTLKEIEEEKVYALLPFLDKEFIDLNDFYKIKLFYVYKENFNTFYKLNEGILEDFQRVLMQRPIFKPLFDMKIKHSYKLDSFWKEDIEELNKTFGKNLYKLVYQSIEPKQVRKEYIEKLIAIGKFSEIGIISRSDTNSILFDVVNSGNAKQLKKLLEKYSGYLKFDLDDCNVCIDNLNYENFDKSIKETGVNFYEIFYRSINKDKKKIYLEKLIDANRIDRIKRISKEDAIYLFRKVLTSKSNNIQQRLVQLKMLKNIKSKYSTIELIVNKNDFGSNGLPHDSYKFFLEDLLKKVDGAYTEPEIIGYQSIYSALNIVIDRLKNKNYFEEYYNELKWKFLQKLVDLGKISKLRKMYPEDFEALLKKYGERLYKIINPDLIKNMILYYPGKFSNYYNSLDVSSRTFRKINKELIHLLNNYSIDEKEARKYHLNLERILNYSFNKLNHTGIKNLKILGASPSEIKEAKIRIESLKTFTYPYKSEEVTKSPKLCQNSIEDEIETKLHKKIKLLIGVPAVSTLYESAFLMYTYSNKLINEHPTSAIGGYYLGAAFALFTAGLISSIELMRH